MEVSKLAQSIQKSKIRVMYDLAAQQKDKEILNFTLGEPDFKTPQSIIDECTKYFNMGYTKYTPNSGIPELKQCIADMYEPIVKHSINPESEVIVTVGATEALLVAMQTIMNPGDEIILFDPSFPSYATQAKICQCNARYVTTLEENGWEPKIEDIKAAITERTKMILLNSPCNPTGAMLSREKLEEIAALCVEYDLVAISDEVYKDIRYNKEEYVSIASLPQMAERTIVVNAFSKTYAMPGWRLGYAVGPGWIISSMPKTHDANVVCVCAPFQYAGVHALKCCGNDVTKMVKAFEQRKNLVYNGINSIEGLSAIEPKGAFYLFFNIKKTGLTSEEFAHQLLEETGVVLVPGSGFGLHGEGYIRMSYASDEEALRKGIQRIKEFVDSLQ